MRERAEAKAEIWPIVVVGAGAAGAMAAIFASRANVKTLVLDARRHPGAKIRVSGGGRCNILPQTVCADDYDSSGSRNIIRNLLLSWPVAQVRAFFETSLGLPLMNEAPRKVFPKSGRSKDVVHALYQELERVGASVKTQWRVQSIRKCPQSGTFRLESELGEVLECSRLIVATGGLSMPTTGSDGSGFKLAQTLGHPSLPLRPALAGLVGQTASFASLAGISVEALVTVRLRGKKIRDWKGPLLFTHRGLSGPVALDASLDFDPQLAKDITMTCAWEPASSEAESRQQWRTRLEQARGQTLQQVLRDSLPRRLADVVCHTAGLLEQAERRANELSRIDREKLLLYLTACPMNISATEGYKTAEITRGGISLESVKGKTLESKTTDSLYFAGEILDVTGRLGGFNFQWAWVSGRRAGESAAKAWKLAEDALPQAA